MYDPLAQWRRLQSSQEKWDEGLMRWYQKKKCERKCVAEVILTSLNNNLSTRALAVGYQMQPLCALTPIEYYFSSNREHPCIT